MSISPFLTTEPPTSPTASGNGDSSRRNPRLSQSNSENVLGMKRARERTPSPLPRGLRHHHHHHRSTAHPPTSSDSASRNTCVRSSPLQISPVLDSDNVTTANDGISSSQISCSSVFELSLSVPCVHHATDIDCGDVCSSDLDYYYLEEGDGNSNSNTNENGNGDVVGNQANPMSVTCTSSHNNTSSNEDGSETKRVNGKKLKRVKVLGAPLPRDSRYRETGNKDTSSSGQFWVQMPKRSKLGEAGDVGDAVQLVRETQRKAREERRRRRQRRGERRQRIHGIQRSGRGGRDCDNVCVDSDIDGYDDLDTSGDSGCEDDNDDDDDVDEDLLRMFVAFSSDDNDEDDVMGEDITEEGRQVDGKEKKSSTGKRGLGKGKGKKKGGDVDADDCDDDVPLDGIDKEIIAELTSQLMDSGLGLGTMQSSVQKSTDKISGKTKNGRDSRSSTKVGSGSHSNSNTGNFLSTFSQADTDRRMSLGMPPQRPRPGHICAVEHSYNVVFTTSPAYQGGKGKGKRKGSNKGTESMDEDDVWEGEIEIGMKGFESLSLGSDGDEDEDDGYDSYREEDEDSSGYDDGDHDSDGDTSDDEREERWFNIQVGWNSTDDDDDSGLDGGDNKDISRRRGNARRSGTKEKVRDQLPLKGKGGEKHKGRRLEDGSSQSAKGGTSQGRLPIKGRSQGNTSKTPAPTPVISRAQPAFPLSQLQEEEKQVGGKGAGRGWPTGRQSIRSPTNTVATSSSSSSSTSSSSSGGFLVPTTPRRSRTQVPSTPASAGAQPMASTTPTGQDSTRSGTRSRPGSEKRSSRRRRRNKQEFEGGAMEEQEEGDEVDDIVAEELSHECAFLLQSVSVKEPSIPSYIS